MYGQSITLNKVSPCLNNYNLKNFSGPLSRFGPGGLLSSPGGSGYSTASSPNLLGPHPNDCLGPRGLVIDLAYTNCLVFVDGVL